MTTILLYGSTEGSAALRHELPLSIGDPLLFAEVDGRRHVLTSLLERDRIAKAAPDVELHDYVALGMRRLIEDGMPREAAERETIVRALHELGIEAAVVPGGFPLALGDRLRAAGVELTIDDAAIDLRRRAKRADELAGIRVAARAAEAGMAAARDALFSAEPDGEGRLIRDGRPLLAEDVRDALRTACAGAGAPCPPDVMVSSAWSAFGHDSGSGPLPAGRPIVVDLWPRHEASACWADMTRTFVVGPPTAEHAEQIAELEALVGAALQAAIAAVRPGVTGRELFDRTCERFEAAGFATQRTTNDPDTVDGFQFALGHGVGLEVHEAPGLGLAGAEPLIAGDVLALEPGLCRGDLREVRFEDLVLVTETGAERLTDFPYDLTA